LAEVRESLKALKCSVRQHTYTKWLPISELFDGELASEASLAFAAFVAMRPIATFTSAENDISLIYSTPGDKRGECLCGGMLL
jgi:hypothetical protein